MEESDGMTLGSASGATSKKSSKKSSKHHHHHNLTPSKTKARGHHHVSLPPSIAERPKSPLLVHANNSKHSGRSSERYSGLWECYYDHGRREDVMGEGGDSVRGEDPANRLKNIRGFILKRRKSPLKGWHKRYFMLEQGTLYFSRNQTQMLKGKVLGSLDLGLSFIHTDAATRRIDIDGEHQVLHLKTKNPGHFTAWSSCLLSHEMYRKTQLAAGTEGHAHLGKGGVAPLVLVGDEENLDSWAERTQSTITGVRKDLDVIRENLEAMSVYVRSPVPNNQSAYNANVGAANFPHTSSSSELKQLENGCDSVSTQSTASSSGTGSDAPRGSIAGTTEGAKGEGGGGGKIKKKFRKGKQDKKIKDSSSNLSPEQLAPFGSTSQLLVDESISSTVATIDSSANRDDFTATAKITYAQFCELLDKLDKVGSGLNQVVQQTNSTLRQQEMIISNQQLLLRQSLLQSNELRDRLSQIQQLASGIDTPASLRVGTPGLPTRRTPSQSYHGASIPRFDSYMSLQSSLSEKFFDALDDLRERSSESEEEEEEVLNTEEEEESQEEESDNELYTSLTHDVISAIHLPPTPKQSMPSVYTLPKAPSEDVREEVEVRQRRTKLSCPMQDMGDLSLWSILRKNIGKDLSKISMPVTLNEPLSALQRLCEELEYSELLDEAASHDNIYDRMVKVAAFAVSSFALNFHRAGRKPFNPILGETYECVREDKGFKFIAEQVSHHPPIAACHCTSPNFNFWQDARIKSKFWGKSMEVFPIGITNVTLPKHGDHYRWQKVTSCIHNVLGGQRWVDLYGEMIINNEDKCTCKLTFVKASYWSSKKYIVHGDVYDSDGVKVRHLFGTWHEAIFCGENPDSAHCVWRAAQMPEDYEQYFSFGQYAIELNELEEGLKDKLPQTDCRFRPDQRLLEEGFVQEAGVEKHRVEQIQREARAERERLGLEWRPNFFELSEDESEHECWVSKGNYWEHRETGFNDINLSRLW